MKSTVRLSLGLITFSSFLAFTACDDDSDRPQGGAGNASQAGSGSGGSSTTKPGHGGSDAKAGEGHGGGGHGDAPVICQVVGSLCHDADTGPGMGRDCHQLGHAGDVETCEDRFASCIGFCVEGESGAGGGGGEGEDPYCAALGSLCHPIEAGIGPECHNTGHEGDGAACRDSFEECSHFCLEEREKLEHGAGGAGGQGAGGQPGAGGHLSAGGAGGAP